MATKKKPSAKTKAKPKASASGSSSRLENLAARPSFDETLDEQLVDHSGVFRVTTQITRAQTGKDEEQNRRFPNDSLVMAAQRDSFRDEPVPDDPLSEQTIDDEATLAVKRERLATLAARSEARSRSRR